MASDTQNSSFQADVWNSNKPTTIDLIGGIFCHICNSTHSNKKEYDKHYVEHNLGNKETVYTCVVCRKQLTGYRSFREHCYNVHVSKDKFKCSECYKMFSKQSVLNQHIATVHTFECVECNDKFSTRREHQMHQSKHRLVTRNLPPYPCKSCCETIETVDMCELHIDDNSITVYQCPICEDTMATKPDAIKHLTKHFGDVLDENNSADETNNKVFEDSSIDLVGGILCSICDELFKNRMEFDLHFVMEHGDREKLYSCVICKKQFNKYCQFGHHCYFHVSKDRFECNDCGKTFSRLSLLVLHTEAFHAGGEGAGGGAQKPFPCATCGRAFLSGARLREHLRRAHATQRAACTHDGCGKTFESPKDLILHQRNHKESHENWCRHCGLHFTTLSACEKHLDVHRIKHYHCPICNREYREKYILLKHIPQHFETILHVCNICGKSYNARSRLIQHSKTHSASKSYTCRYCGKGFLKSQQLEQHVNIHTGMRPFKCTNCPKTFASYPNWAKHLLRMHNIDHKLIKKQMATDTAKTVNTDEEEALDQPSGNSSNSVMSVEPQNAEADESRMDSIDPAAIERELKLYEQSDMYPDTTADTQATAEQMEYMEVMPSNTATFVPDGPAACSEGSPGPAAGAGVGAGGVAGAAGGSGVPPEYGPDFVNRAIEASSFHGEYIDLDDHIMPHIDPLLTIKTALTQGPMHYDNYEQNDFDYQTWEPPIITRVYENYHYEDMADDSKISIMNTDIF